MTYIKRKSDSNIPQKSIEYLQDGIILHFNEITLNNVDMNEEKSISYECDELWVETLEGLGDILLKENLVLNEEQINFIKNQN